MNQENYMMPLFLDGLIVLLPLIALFSGMAMTPLLGVFLLLILIAVPNETLRTPRSVSPQYRLLLGVIAIVLLWPVVTSLWSITPPRSLSTGLRILFIYLAGALAFIYVPGVKPMNACGLHKYAYMLMFVGVLVMLELLPHGGIIHYIDDQAQIDYERFENKNINRGLCALAVLIWPAMHGFYKLGKPREGWLALVVMGAGLLVMHSLSAKVGLVAGVVTFFAIRRFPVFVPRAIVVLLPLYLLSFSPLFLLFEPTVFTWPSVVTHLPPSAIHRLHIWHELMQLVAQKPWFGWGMDTSRAAPLSAESLSYLGLTMPPLHPHSPSLQLLLETGIVGLLLAVAGLAVLLRAWLRVPVTDTVTRATSGALIVAYFATGVSSFGIWQFWWIAVLWIAALLWRRMDNMRPNESQTS